MIAGIASLVFIPLLALFFAHMLWALGSTWPVTSREQLARTVIGRSGEAQMPSRWWSLGVAFFLGIAGLVALGLSDPSPMPALTMMGAVLALVFLVRGALGFMPKWQSRHTTEPFAGLDRRVYSPLSLFIGLGLIILIVWRLT